MGCSALQCPGQAGVNEVGGRAWFLHPFLMPKDGMEWAVIKPKAGTLFWCVTFKPLLVLAIVLCGSGRGREMYHIKIRCTQ